MQDQCTKLTRILQRPPTYQRSEENRVDFKKKVEDMFEYFFSMISSRIESPTFDEEKSPRGDEDWELIQ